MADSIVCEEWRHVTGRAARFDYEVSNCGQVRSAKTWKLLRQHTTRGYSRVMLMNGHDDRYHARVHVLVAEAFMGMPGLGQQVNHIDCDKRNNESRNLEWVTGPENIRHAVKAGRFENVGGTGIGGENNWQSKLSDDLVREARRLRAIGQTISSIIASLGVSCNRKTLDKAVRGQTWKHVA